ncbi:MAG TPA: S41 family peptidase [Kofleriaceae bacterium]
MHRAASPRAAGSPIVGQAASFTLVSLALAACGDNSEGVPTEIFPEDVYAARCAHPRSGNDPTTGQAYLDVSGSVLDEKLWVRSWIDDLYLWYREVPAVDITQFTDAVSYFNQERTPEKTASGKDRDQFHFTIDTADWVAMSQSGVEAGYGVQWALLATKPPRSLLVAYTEPGSPAAAAGLDRGARIVSIDNVDLQNGSDTDTLNNGLYPANLGEKHTFVVVDRGATAPHTVTLTSASIDLKPVLSADTLPPPNDKVGYIQFTDHIATAEKELVDAITLLRNKGATDLILDMRYNGGGYLDIASELAYMIAGPTATAGKTFERLAFNDKHTADGMPEGFVDHSEGFVPELLPSGRPLPSLGLSRVFVLTGSGTCSASESVMNSLAGVDVEIIQIGETTCGKPYGFLPADNCGTTFFAIQFQGVNNKGFGDYADGFAPGGNFHGCTVSDDFGHALGDPAEARIAAALAYRANPVCPAAPQVRQRPAAEAVIPKPIWRQNRILRR